jgi:hypothetical protein
MNEPAGIIFALSGSYNMVFDAVKSYYEGIGYVKFTGKIPENYPAEPEEFKDVYFSAESEEGYFFAAIREFNLTFEIAFRIARKLKNVSVIAFRQSFFQEPVLKIYRGSDIILKAGTDEDSELMYYPPLLNEDTLRNSLSSVGKLNEENSRRISDLLDKGNKIDMKILLQMLEIPRIENILSRLKMPDHASDFIHVRFISKRSALYLNS